MKRKRHEKQKITYESEKNLTNSISKENNKTPVRKGAFVRKNREQINRWSSLYWSIGFVFILIGLYCFIIFTSNPSKQKSDVQFETREQYNDIYENVTRIMEVWDKNSTHLLKIQRFMDKYIYSTNTHNVTSPSQGYLHPRLRSAPHRRTHFLPLFERDSKDNNTRYKSRPIKSGETILELPRRFLLWDLDAFRCTFIQQHLFHARHNDTGNFLDGGAYLAAFLLYRQKISTSSWRFPKNNTYHLQYTQEQDDLLNTYLKILPHYSTTYTHNNNTFSSTNHHFHPVLWSESECLKYLGQNTLSYNLVHAYRYMITSEYHAFNHSSSMFDNQNTTSRSIFGDNISLMEYIQMRMHVMTRSFGTGTPGTEEEFVTSPSTPTSSYMNIQEELQFYKASTGVDLTIGCRAMSPILDLWDHHASPNADWKYHSSKRAFIIKATGPLGIQPGYDVWVSYGKYSDTHLFSKFGFVNGDGSGYTESSIAAHHNLLDPGMGQQFSFMSRNLSVKSIPLPNDYLKQKEDILKYLEYDDGYNMCIDDKNSVAFALKKLKFQVLLNQANIYDRWVIIWHPRNSSAQPLRGSNIAITGDPPVFDVKRVTFDGSKVLSTCRLITLIHDDYDGHAITVLEQALKNESMRERFMVTRQNDLSEFRSLNCLVRLTSAALSKYPKTTMDFYSSLQSSSLTNGLTYGSPEWTSSHVVLGEMLSLESLRNIAISGARMMSEKLRLEENSMIGAFIRKQPCSLSLSSLWDDVKDGFSLGHNTA